MRPSVDVACPPDRPHEPGVLPDALHLLGPDSGTAVAQPPGRYLAYHDREQRLLAADLGRTPHAVTT